MVFFVGDDANQMIVFYSICLLTYNVYKKPNTPQSVSRPSLSSPAISVDPRLRSKRLGLLYLQAHKVCIKIEDPTMVKYRSTK